MLYTLQEKTKNTEFTMRFSCLSLEEAKKEVLVHRTIPDSTLYISNVSGELISVKRGDEEWFNLYEPHIL